MSDLAACRRFYAEEIQAVSNLTSATVVEALATVPRERFLPPGPWTIRGEADFQAPPRQTPDADPRHVHHNIAVAIDAGRTLFNGAPSVVAMAIDALGLKPGGRVLQLGTGAGYYTAIIAHCVGPTGRVLGIEVDNDLADAARRNHAGTPWVEIRGGDGSDAVDETFDAVLVNAGVTHPLPAWLDCLAPEGRLIAPITAALSPASPISKGPMVLMARTAAADRLTARVIGFVAIYSALGIRDDATNGLLGQLMATMPYAPLASARRDAHDCAAACWLHTPGFCLSTASWT